MQEDKNKVETILFTTGRFIGLEELGRLAGIGSLGYLKEVIDELKKGNETKNGSLQITEQGSKYKLAIKKEYLHLTESLLTDSEMDKPTQETLAVIAYKNPAFQSEIIKIRGNKAYDHIKMLKELDFVTSTPSGRTNILKLTNKFYDYFDIVEDQLKSKLESVEKREENKQEASPNETQN